MIGDSSSWPFLHLNHLSPVVSPDNPSIHATRVEDLAFPVDSADLSRQLETWSNVKFAFDEDKSNPSFLHPPSGAKDTMTIQTQAFGPHDVAKTGGYASMDGPNPYSSRRTSGATSAIPAGSMHPLFAHTHGNTYRAAPHLPFDFQNPVYGGGQSVDNGTSQMVSFPQSSLGMSAFMATASAENLFSGMPLSYPFEPTTAAGTELSDYDGLQGLAGLAELASATSHAPVVSEPVAQMPVAAPMSRKPSAAHAVKQASPTVPIADSQPQATSSVDARSAANPPTPEDDDGSRVAVEEDKRKRNTAASARFRIKKKLREQAVERTASDLRDRVTELEKEVEGLKRENGWLRGLIVDRATREPKTNTAPASAPSGTVSPSSASSSISASKRPRREDA